MNDKQREKISWYPKPPDFKPEPIFGPETRYPGKPRCTAWSCRNGRQCDKLPIRGKTKCRSHGGTSPSGITHGRYKHGRYRTILRQNLVAAFERSIQDKDLLALNNEIALVDTRTEELLGKLDTGESGANWKRLTELVSEFDYRKRMAKATLSEADKKRYEAEAAENLNQILVLVRKGQGDFSLWNEVKDNLEQRRRLVETERRRLMDMEAVLTTEKALALVNALGMAVRAYVTDGTTLTSIEAEFRRLVYSNPLPSSAERQYLDTDAEG